MPQGMKVARVDSEEPGEGSATNAIDGKPETFWHTNYSKDETSHPHEIDLDLGSNLSICGLAYTPRQGQDNGRIDRYGVYVSVDGKAWGDPIVVGSLKNESSKQWIRFPKVLVARYVRLRALSEVTGRVWTTIAELAILVPK